RRELLLQAARTFRRLLRERGASATVGWFAESSGELHADLVFASVAKLARAAHLEKLREHRFDYVVVDEVHHAAASSYRKILDALEPGFTLGLTATPERADGADVLGLFDDHVAHRAGIAEGIQLGRLVPFHYFGVKDTIDYANIPWRNRRFDPDELTKAAETEARMESLWRAWQEHRGARTILFCCSITHASFVKQWLAERGVTARAIHSDPSSDDRSEALRELADGAIDAVCAVDVLNEGVDVPAVDRVVMLRPTESNVVFLQQLGRGLRAHAETGKQALTVIDFVGNHRLFLDRLRALLTLGEGRVARDLRQLVAGDEPIDLPEACRVELELEAKELLSRLFRSDGADEVERAYRELAASRDQRPRAGELYRMGYAIAKLRDRHGSWFDFVQGEGDLTAGEEAALSIAGAFLRDLEKTPMTKCFKMVTLQALIEHDALTSGMPVAELARRSHRILHRDPTLLADLPETHRHTEPTEGWERYWRKNPIAAWTGENKKGRAWFRLAGDRFVPSWEAEADDATREEVARMVAELVDMRLAQYRRRLDVGGERESFSCRVTWNQRDPILKLPSRQRAKLPEGETDVRLRDGSVWVFRFMKEYCNVARPAGVDRNQLPDLLRAWFGPSAGQPGTAMQVRFEAGPDGWTVGPEQAAQVISFPRRAIAAYPDLRAAAGHAADASLAPEATPVELPVDATDRQELFAVRVAGASMDGGRRPLRDGDWAVFRVARGVRAASMENRVALVQVPAETDAHGYLIKRIRRADGGWVLASDNPEGPTIAADESMVVVAKLERGFHPEELAPERGAQLTDDELAGAFGLSEL
ncbi:MAG: DEAD/DEAH box helicase family protein, partial [Sandaracinus sp.]|nr:DEAD/DEAH box helicase family protein [Sandaracinus sp.]